MLQAKTFVSKGIRGAVEDYYNDPDIHFALDTIQTKVHLTFMNYIILY